MTKHELMAYIGVHYIIGGGLIGETKAVTSSAKTVSVVKGAGNAFTTTKNAASAVGKELNGTVTELKNGWKVEIPNGKKTIVVRIMNEGSGGRSEPYFRVSNDATNLNSVRN